MYNSIQTTLLHEHTPVHDHTRKCKASQTHL